MKRIIPKEAHKIVLGVFILTSTYIILYEFYLTSLSKVGAITSRIAYSILATCIFYFLSIYLPVYLPKQKRKRNVLFNAYQKVLLINSHVSGLKVNLGMFDREFEDAEWFRSKLESIDPATPAGRFNTWHQYLAHLKKNLLEIIQSMTIQDEYLTTEFYHEIILFEEELLHPYTFEDDRTLLIDTLEFGYINLQQVCFHTKHLLEIREREYKKYEKYFKKDGAEYRKTYFEPLNLKSKNK